MNESLDRLLKEASPTGSDSSSYASKTEEELESSSLNSAGEELPVEIQSGLLPRNPNEKSCSRAITTRSGGKDAGVKNQEFIDPHEYEYVSEGLEVEEEEGYYHNQSTKPSATPVGDAARASPDE